MTPNIAATTSPRDRKLQTQLMEIVIGAAWADQHLEPGEVDYLNRLLERYGLERSEHLKDLLSKPVSLQTTLAWVLSYLKDTTEAERHRAVVALANLFIADDDVVDVEHDILDELHRLMARIPAQPEDDAVQQGWLSSLGRWVRTAIAH